MPANASEVEGEGQAAQKQGGGIRPMPGGYPHTMGRACVHSTLHPLGIWTPVLVCTRLTTGDGGRSRIDTGEPRAAAVPRQRLGHNTGARGRVKRAGASCDVQHPVDTHTHMQRHGTWCASDTWGGIAFRWGLRARVPPSPSVSGGSRHPPMARSQHIAQRWRGGGPAVG